VLVESRRKEGEGERVCPLPERILCRRGRGRGGEEEEEEEEDTSLFSFFLDADRRRAHSAWTSTSLPTSAQYVLFFLPLPLLGNDRCVAPFVTKLLLTLPVFLSDEAVITDVITGHLQALFESEQGAYKVTGVRNVFVHLATY
jgi:hypothetical protein